VNKKPIWLIVLGMIVILSAVIFQAAVSLRQMIKFSDKTITFLVPSETDIVIKKDGRYHLWNNYKWVLNGEKYESEKDLLEKVNIKLISFISGSEINIAPQTSLKNTRGSSVKTSIGYYFLEEGKYQLIVTGDFSQRVFSFSPSIWKLFLTVFGSGYVLLVGLVVGIAMIVFGIFRILIKNK